jgi:dCTP deaminase
MILSDREIAERVRAQRMIEPFVDHQVVVGVVSYGLSSYGYDFRVADEFKVFQGTDEGLIDPKGLDDGAFVDVVADDVCVIPPNSFALARSLEVFRIPRDILALCAGKSTYARCGILLNVTPLEPEWEGHITLAISNTTPLPARIYAHEGVGQIIFLRASEVCRVSYADREGRYQKQQGIVLPRVG